MNSFHLWYDHELSRRQRRQLHNYFFISSAKNSSPKNRRWMRSQTEEKEMLQKRNGNGRELSEKDHQPIFYVVANDIYVPFERNLLFLRRVICLGDKIAATTAKASLTKEDTTKNWRRPQRRRNKTLKNKQKEPRNAMKLKVNYTFPYRLWRSQSNKAQNKRKTKRQRGKRNDRVRIKDKNYMWNDRECAHVECSRTKNINRRRKSVKLFLTEARLLLFCLIRPMSVVFLAIFIRFALFPSLQSSVYLSSSRMSFSRSWRFAIRKYKKKLKIKPNKRNDVIMSVRIVLLPFVDRCERRNRVHIDDQKK